MERCCTTNPLWPYLHLDLHAYSKIKCLWYSNCNMQYMLPHFSNKIYSMPIKRILLIKKHALEWKESSICIYQLLTSENFITASNPNFSLLLKRFAYALFSESPRFYNWISSINWITGIMFIEHRHILWCRAPNHCLFLIHATQSERWLSNAYSYITTRCWWIDVHHIQCLLNFYHLHKMLQTPVFIWGTSSKMIYTSFSAWKVYSIHSLTKVATASCFHH